MKLLLCIDTAGSRCAVALCDLASGDIRAQAEPDIGRGHAEVLMGLIEELLAANSAHYSDVGKIAVVVGPGSFTGLRVGVAAAKGLALALAIPAVGISSLEVMAEPHLAGDLPVLSVIDAKRGEVYAALYAPGGGVLHAAEAVSPDDLRGFVGDTPALLAVGTGAAIAADILGSRVSVAVDPDGQAGLAALARLGIRHSIFGGVKPLYLRGADAKPQAATGILHVQAAAILP
jgi:tRNA threonylcarbamoyladenosine biosynthesis protein TsaB